jgi:hypothetical protein
LAANVVSFEEKIVDGGKKVVFYKVMVGFLIGNNNWIMEKRFSDFDSLYCLIKD